MDAKSPRGDNSSPRPSPAAHLDPARHRAGRRLRLAARRQLAGGDARSRVARLRHPCPSRSRECLHFEASWPTPKRCKQTLFAEMKGRIKEDDSVGSGARRGVRLLHALRHRRAASAVLPHDAGRRRGADPARRQRACQGRTPISASPMSRTAPTTSSSPMPSTPRARSSTPSNIIEAATGAIIDTRIADNNGPLRMGGRQPHAALCLARRRAPPPQGLAPRDRRRADQTRSSMSSRTPATFLGLGATQDRRFLLLSVHDHETAEISLIDADDPSAPPRLVAPREPEHDYSVEHHGDRLIILTNSDGAEDYRIVEAPVDTPGREHWREIEPHQPGPAHSRRSWPIKDYLVRLEREDGLPRIVIRRFADGDRARDRLRRGSLRARHLAWLRIRHARRCASPIRR